MESDRQPVLSLVGDVLRLFTVLMFFVLLVVIVSDIYTYGYASHFLDIRIVLAHAVPTLWTLAGAALAIIIINVVVELVPQLSEVTLFSRIFKQGPYVGLINFEDPWRILIFVAAAYLLIPAAAGKLVAISQTNFQVVKLNEPTRNLKEAIIVTPAVNGVLLALYDRTKNTVLAGEMVLDTLGPDEPHFSQKETLGRLARAR
jgi:hypothetical protein